MVLSACETALGDIQGSEGVYGLQRAFKIAGIPNLIMSLWKVPDTETVEFMQEFYKNLFAGESISSSFYQAQNTLKINTAATLQMGSLGPCTLISTTIMKSVITIFVLILSFSLAHSQLWKAYADTAKSYRTHDSADKSIEYYKKAVEELEKRPIRFDNVCKDVCKWSDFRCPRRHNINKQSLYAEARLIGGKLLGMENADYAAYCYNLASLYYTTGDYNKAEQLYLEDKQISEKLSGKYHLTI